MSAPVTALVVAAVAAALLLCTTAAAHQPLADACPAGQYGPNASSCTSCNLSELRCLGGALVLPAPGWWQPEPTAGAISRCLNPAACLGFPDEACAELQHPQQALRQCHPFCNTSTPDCGGGVSCNSSCDAATYLARQCAEGYIGQLCAVCSPGWSLRNQFKCVKCGSPAAAAALFAVAAVVLMGGIRLWAFLAENENVEMAAALNSLAHSTAAAHGVHTARPPQTRHTGSAAPASTQTLCPTVCRAALYQGASQTGALLSHPGTRQQTATSRSTDVGAHNSKDPVELPTSAVSQPPWAHHALTASRQLPLPTPQHHWQHRAPAVLHRQLQLCTQAASQPRLSFAVSPGSASLSPEHVHSSAARSAPGPLTATVCVVEGTPFRGGANGNFSSESVAHDSFSSLGSCVSAVDSCDSDLRTCSWHSEGSDAEPRGDSSGVTARSAATKAAGTSTAATRPVQQSSACAGTVSVQPSLIGGNRARPSDVLRCLLLFVQFWVIFASMHFEWPAVIATPIALLAAVLAVGHAPPIAADCIVAGSGVQDLGHVAIMRSVFQALVPFAMLLLLLVLELARWWLMAFLKNRILRCPAGKTVSFQHIITCRAHLITLAALFFFYPHVARTCLSLFVCVPITDASPGAGLQFFWAGYTNIQCGVGWHNTLRLSLGIILLLLVCPGLPLSLMVLLLYHSRKLTTDRSVVLRYGSLYRCYKQAGQDHPITGRLACAWEGFIMLATTAAVAITVFGLHLGRYEAVLMNVLLSLCAVALLVVKPYRCIRLQRLMLGGAICLSITLYVAMVFFTADQILVGGGPADAALKEVLGVLLLLGNVACVLWGAYEMMLVLDWLKMYRAVSAAVHMVGHVCRTCWKYAKWFAVEH